MSFLRFLAVCAFSLTLASQVQAGPNNGWPLGLVNECDTTKSEWIWCEDFEKDRSADYFEGTADRQASLGLNGSTASAFHFKKGISGGGGIKIAFGRTPSSYLKPVDSGENNYREIFWRMFIYLPTTWMGNGADKLSRATILASADWKQAMIAHVWSGSDPGSQSNLLLVDPASGTDAAGNLMTLGYNDFDNLRWLGYVGSNFPIFASENFGKWHCVEAHVKLNDPGQSNGVFQLYINNALEVDRTSLNWIGSYDAYGINAIFFENYWNQGSPVDQTRYFDNLVVSTQAIGCGQEGVTPMPPSNLTVTQN